MFETPILIDINDSSDVLFNRFGRLNRTQSVTEKELNREICKNKADKCEEIIIIPEFTTNGSLDNKTFITTLKSDINNNDLIETTERKAFGRSLNRSHLNHQPPRRHFSSFGRLLKSAKCHALTETSTKIHSTSFDNTMNQNEILVFPKSIAWDWPFSDEGFYTEEKFIMCLPFNNGGTGETSGSTKKFSKIMECNFSWTIGLSTNDEFGGTTFWRMELEIMRNLNMLALIVSRDIARSADRPKKLRRVRKVYRLPNIYDISTLSTVSYDWAIVIEALRRRDVRTNRYTQLKRSETFDF